MQCRELTGQDVEIESELSASTVTCWRSTGGQKSGQKSEERVLTTQEKILGIIRDNPKVTRKILVSELKISASAIQKHINALKGDWQHLAMMQVKPWLH